MAGRSRVLSQRDIWSGPRLALLLGFYFQGAKRGVDRVNARIVAGSVGVTAGTVRRWVRSGYPAKRMPELEALVLPGAAALEQELYELIYARRAVASINDAKTKINPAWEEQRWLEPHVLGLVQFPHLGVTVPRISRSGSEKKTSDRARAGNGVVVENYLFGNRFAAQIAKGELLEALYPYRIVLPAGILPRGRTEAWFSTTRLPKLSWMSLSRTSIKRS